MKEKRLAAIDIGTNSIRCIVAEVDPKGSYRVLDDEKATVRLGEGLNRTGGIASSAWQRAIEALTRMKKIVDGYGVVAIEAVATSAVRSATNGREFIAAIAEEVGIKVTIISGEEEAELAALSARHHFDMNGIRHVMMDIGGGSIEIVTALGNHIEEIYSFDLGVVFLTENFIHHDPIKRLEDRAMRKHIRATLQSVLAGERCIAQSLICSGGTMTSIAAMLVAIRREEYGTIHGYEILRSDIVHLLAMLSRKDLKARRAVPGLNPDRADIIVAGLIAVDEIMRFFDANTLKINERGIREGLILKSLRKYSLLPDEGERGWRQSVIEFARSCHFDEEHSLQVVKLSLEIFDALTDTYKFSEKERNMLETAAILHDSGYLISYASHHKHSYHLIRHADLYGFSPREKEIIAHIARYHRKSLPKKKHEAYRRLSEQDQTLVDRLGGILRLADGLDRRRSGVISSLECTLSTKTFKIMLKSAGDTSVEVFGGKNKGDLFEIAYDLRLMVLPSQEAHISSA